MAERREKGVTMDQNGGANGEIGRTQAEDDDEKGAQTRERSAAQEETIACTSVRGRESRVARQH